MLNSNIFPAFAQNNVPVVVAPNNLYAPYAGVFIQSLLDHASERNNYDIIILSRDISEENQRLLKSLAAGHPNVSVRCYDPSPLFASFHYNEDEHDWPLEIFYKITAPHILHYSGRMIVVDIDTLLRTDIARLLEADLDGCCVGGVTHEPLTYARCLLDRTYLPTTRKIRLRDTFAADEWKDFELYKTRIPLNGGLLLFDCDKYLAEADLETVLGTAQQSNSATPDETTLNSLMHGKIKLLDLAWNVLVPTNRRRAEEHAVKEVPKIYNLVYNDNEAYERATRNPYILHWMGRPKPWVCPDVPYGSEWWQTALRTPFVGHIIARMTVEQERRRQYCRERYGKEDADVWDPSPEGKDWKGR